MKTINSMPLLAGILCVLAGCSKEDAIDPSEYNIETEPDKIVNGITFDPDNFVTVIDNPFLPFTPGDTYYYVNTSFERGEESVENITVTVTCETKVILGVTTTVVHDVVTDEEGNIVENTFDWYAQDEQGNVWYFGEFTESYEDGEVSTEGSWEAGVDGAEAGIIMWADPREHIGEAYYQEFYPGEAEDQAIVLPSQRTVKVPYGMFHQTLTTEEFTALEPDVHERKTYVEGIGLVLAQAVKGSKEREELVAITHGNCTD
jgi:hypothetical protein